jgi:hypothetical protein
MGAKTFPVYRKEADWLDPSVRKFCQGAGRPILYFNQNVFGKHCLLSDPERFHREIIDKKKVFQDLPE